MRASTPFPVLLALLLPLGAAALSGCEVRQALAPSEPLADPAPVGEFPLFLGSLRENSVFLWKGELDEVTGRWKPGSLAAEPGQVSAVLAVSRRIDAMTDETFFVQSRETAIGAEFKAATGADLIELNQERTGAQGSLETAETSLRGANRQLVAELAKPLAEHDVRKLERLRKQVTALERQREQARETLARSDAELAKPDAQALYDEYLLKLARRGEIEEETRRQLDVLQAMTDYHDAPKIEFRQREDDGRLVITLDGWDRKDGSGAVSLSSEDGGLRLAGYESHGGRLTLEARFPEATWVFRLARARYAAPDRRTYYQGSVEVFRVVGADGATAPKPYRLGAVKLIEAKRDVL